MLKFLKPFLRVFKMLTSVHERVINAKTTLPVIIQKDHTIAPVTVDLVGTDLTVQVKKHDFSKSFYNI